ncbi:MAG TPA: hypothetical protein VF518_06575, partial [Polyangia bacterium]
ADSLVSPALDAKLEPDTIALGSGADAQETSDTPVPTADAQETSDTPVPTPDVPVEKPDASQDTPKDTAPPCNGGCCTNNDCPLTAPVCNSANTCVGCAGDRDCTGRSATACRTTTGACVPCTSNSQCGGATAACNTATNTCVGCTQRSDCPGTCQTCTNGACVAVKNGDDTPQCAGTCDSAGECKAKKGQKCSSVAAGCLAGTTCSPDNVCCDRACTGSCEACDLPNAAGTCAVLPSGGTPHAGHTPCSGTGDCASTCTGAPNGACVFATKACGTASCSANSSQALGTCDQGTCGMPTPVACKTGASCSGTVCACPSGTFDCGASCANRDSDPKNCGDCGHDCLGGPCEGGYCKPYKLGDVPTGVVNSLTSDGGKVYAFTQQRSLLDTTKVWQTDASTPGIPVKIPPDQTNAPSCVIDGTLVWSAGDDGAGKLVFGYCSVSGCLASTKSFFHAVPTTGATMMENLPSCDLVNKEIVWSESYGSPTDGTQVHSIWRSSPTGANIRQMTSFPALASATSEITRGFPVGRTDRYIFTRTTGDTVQLFSVSTTTKDAAPVVLGTGAIGGPLDLGYGTPYANDSTLVWSTATSTYRLPLPNGVGTSAPPVFYNGTIISGILDNTHFYGFLTGGIPLMQWCSPASCSPTTLTSSLTEAKEFAQDANAIYWAVMNADTFDGFSIWKVAKQPY